MNKKITTQLILFFIIIFIIILFLFKYLIKTETSDIKKIELSQNSSESFSNSIQDIEYKSNDTLGNQYLIKAKYGEILDQNKNLIAMKGVEAQIIFKNYEKIIIVASTAIYNITNYDTNFEDNILIKYGEHEIICNNVDLLFMDHKIKLYNNINYHNLNIDLLADEMEIDLLTKNSTIFMNNQDKKIKMIYNSNEIN
jgi:lipopolysaccharide assembly outer membrane protein LptD (OstA)